MLGRKIKIFVHLVDFVGARSIAEEITDYLIQSNILEQSEVFFYCNYKIENYQWLKEKFKQYKKVHFISLCSVPLDFEIPTLIDMQRKCKKWNRRYYVLYLHHKGASKCDNLAVEDWRNLMCYFNIIKWKECIKKLKKGYDVVGVNWFDGEHCHFSGNFWWTKSDYVKKLPKFKMPHQNNFQPQLKLKGIDYRMESELWIGVKKPHAFCMHKSDVASHYYDRYTKEKYIDG